MLFFLASLACLLFTVPQCYSQDIGYDYPTVTVENLGGSVTFECMYDTVPNDTTPAAWMFPDLTNVDLTYNDSRRWVEEDGYKFVISRVEMEDIGLFHCMLKTSEDEWWLLKIGLNVKGPYFSDLWEIYRMPTIYGFSAMFGFLITVGYVFLIYWFNYDRRLDRQSAVTPGIEEIAMSGITSEKGSSYRLTTDNGELRTEPEKTGNDNKAFEDKLEGSQEKV